MICGGGRVAAPLTSVARAFQPARIGKHGEIVEAEMRKDAEA
jgi:hypothetical protein